MIVITYNIIELPRNGRHFILGLTIKFSNLPWLGVLHAVVLNMRVVLFWVSLGSCLVMSLPGYSTRTVQGLVCPLMLQDCIVLDVISVFGLHALESSIGTWERIAWIWWVRWYFQSGTLCSCWKFSCRLCCMCGCIVMMQDPQVFVGILCLYCQIFS